MPDPERWQEIKSILYSAIELDPADRSAFLDRQCKHDPSLRTEIESLIAAHDAAGEHFESPAVELLATASADHDGNGFAGRSLGNYDVIEKLGSGGMGDVYLARDTRLDRKVAIKLLPEILTSDKQTKQRFIQEAKAASALNHPNIITIYEIASDGGHDYIAMEYVEGETVRDLLARGRIETRRAVELTAQTASGLAAAHDAGIIHRDIKPENLMVTRASQVKILDFGLAKLVEQQRVTLADSNAPTIDLHQRSERVVTVPGTILGTVAYMSPEQAEGRPLDRRSDIFSLGVVFYETITGKRPFEGKSAIDTLHSIINSEPKPARELNMQLPLEVEDLLAKSLAKEPTERYQHAGDFELDLRRFKRALESGSLMSSRVQPQTREGGSAFSRFWWTAAAVVLFVGVVIGATYFITRSAQKPKEAPQRNATFTQLTDQAGPEYFPSLSPDGKSFVYASYAAGNWDIYLQRVGGKNPINLTKDSPADDTQPAFSPDGEQIAFRSEQEGGGIFLMGATGESVKRLTDFGFNPAWSPDGKEIACADEGPVDPTFRSNPNSRVWAVNIATGERRQVTKEDSIQPNWSPHGFRIAYGGRRNAAQRDIWTIPAGGGEPQEVTNDPATEGSPVWSPDGKYLYFGSDRGGSMNVWRVPIEEKTGNVLGPAESVTTPSPYSAQLSFSRDGQRMVYSQIVRGANLQRVGFDPVKETVTGQPVWITHGSRTANTPNLSPDGEWLAFDAQGSTQDDLFAIKRDGTGLRQLTDDIYKDRQPRWSPDGRRIAFFSDRSGKWEIWMINADGSGLKQLTYAPGPVTNPQWSPDGTRIVYRNPGDSPSIIEVEKPWTEQSPQVLPSNSDLSSWGPWSWSPDGRKLSGNRLRAAAPGTGILVYSLESQHYENLTDFGKQPVWLSDSRRLLFLHQSKLYLIDSQSKKVHEVLSVAPNDFGFGVTLSRDDRLIYFSLASDEADVWLMTLE